MPVYLDKKTGRFYIEFQYKNTRYKERLPKHITRRDAEKLEIKLKNNLIFESHIRPNKDITFERFLAEYFGPAIEGRVSKDSYEKAIYVCRLALPFFKGKTMRSIKAADIERFKFSRINTLTIHGRRRQPATVEREMSIISRIFSMAVKNDLCDYNPCSRVDKLPISNEQDKVLKREDEERFFSNMHSEWARDVCRMVLHTGLRQNDLMNLTRFHVKDGYLMLHQGKTKRKVYVMLNSVSREIVERRMKRKERYLFASPVTGNEKGSVRHAMIRACDRAGIERITIRDLRRTFATRAIENGTDAVTTSKMLGHTSLRMLSRYVKSLETMQKAVDQMAESPKNPPAARSENVKSFKKKG